MHFSGGFCPITFLPQLGTGSDLDFRIGSPITRPTMCHMCAKAWTKIVREWFNRGWYRKKSPKNRQITAPGASPVEISCWHGGTIRRGRSRAFQNCINIGGNRKSITACLRKTEFFFSIFLNFPLSVARITWNVQSKTPFRFHSIATPPGRGSPRPPPHQNDP